MDRVARYCPIHPYYIFVSTVAVVFVDRLVIKGYTTSLSTSASLNPYNLLLLLSILSLVLLNFFTLPVRKSDILVAEDSLKKLHDYSETSRSGFFRKEALSGILFLLYVVVAAFSVIVITINLPVSTIGAFLWCSLLFVLSQSWRSPRFTLDRNVMTNCVIIFVALTVAIIALINIYYIVKNAEWILGDDAMFIRSTLSGKRISPPINQANGRFFPLAFQEFNIFIPFGNAPYVYYSWVALKFCVMTILIIRSYCLVITLAHLEHVEMDRERERKIDLSIAYMLLICFLLSPMLFFVFSDIIFPEQSLIVLLVIFLVYYIKAVLYGNTVSFFLAFIFATLSLYFKEPVAGMFMVFSTVHLLKWKYFTSKENLFHILLIISCLIFFVLYHFMVHRHTTQYYNEGRAFGNSIFIICLSIFYNHKFFYFLAPFAIYHAIKYCKGTRKGVIIANALLLSSVSYIAAYALLNLYEGYYFVPIYIFAFPGMLYFALLYKSSSFIGKTKAIFYLIVITGIFMTSTNLSESITLNQLARKNDDAKVNILEKYIEKGHGLVFVNKEYTGDRLFANGVQTWYEDTIETFIDYYLNSERYAGKFKLKHTPIDKIHFEEKTLYILSGYIENGEYIAVHNNLSKVLTIKNWGDVYVK